MISASKDSARPAASSAWYSSITREQWKILAAAMLGWMLDSMDFVLYLMAITTLQKEFQFGFETAGLLASVALLTSAAGGLIFGVVADYIGRTRALMATILIYSLCSLGTATSHSLTELLIWRAALGLGMGGEWSSGAVLVSEAWPAEHRGKAIGIMQSGWAIGYIAAALIASAVLPVLGWRWLFVAGVLPALLVFWIRRGVHEPQVWTGEKSAGKSGNPVTAIFEGKILGKTVFATLMSAAVMFGYWGLFSWLPAFLSSPVSQGGAGMRLTSSVFGWIIPTQIGAFLGYVSFGFVSDRLGRRPAFIAYLIAAAIIAPVYGNMAGSPLTLLLLGPVLGFFGHGYFSLFGAMLAEIFPTRMRGTGQGFTYNAGRAMSALAPLTIGVLAKKSGLGPALGLTSAFFIIGALLVLLLPETRGRQLE